MKRGLLILGPELENRGIGGVTIHIRRLRDYLENKGFDYTFIDYKNSSLFRQLMAISKAKVTHIHICNAIYMFILVLGCKLLGNRSILTYHGNYGRFGSVANLLVRWSISLADTPILINATSYESCRKLNNHCRLLPAFIPPCKKEQLQPEIIETMEKLHSQGKKIVSTNAYNISIGKYGEEVYGIGFLVEYFMGNEEYVLVVSDPSGNYKKRYKKINDKSIHFIGYPHPYFELLKHSDYFVRNTSTDGDALSVKEALYIGIPALCSDVVDRPKGVKLFKYCDYDTFDNVLKQNRGETDIRKRPINGAVPLLNLYKEMISNKL